MDLHCCCCSSSSSSLSAAAVWSMQGTTTGIMSRRLVRIPLFFIVIVFAERLLCLAMRADLFYIRVSRTREGSARRTHCVEKRCGVVSCVIINSVGRLVLVSSSVGMRVCVRVIRLIDGVSI